MDFGNEMGKLILLSSSQCVPFGLYLVAIILKESLYVSFLVSCMFSSECVRVYDISCV